MVLLALILVVDISAASPFSCDDVRAYVQEHGKAASYAKAAEMLLARQMTWAQFRAAKRCLAVPKGASG